MGKSRVKGIVVEIGGNTMGLDKALDGTNKKIYDTQQNLKDVERLLKLDPTNTTLLEQKQRLLSEAIAETEDKLQALNIANEQNKDSVKNYDAWKAAYDPIQEEIDTTRKKLEELKKQQEEMAEVGETDTDAYKQLTEEIQTTSRELKDLKQKAKEVNEEFGNPISPEKYDALQREIMETENNLRELKSQSSQTWQGVASELKDTQKELREVNRLLDLDPANVVLLGQKQELLTAAINQTRESIEKMEDAYDDMYGALVSGASQGKDDFRKLEREIEAAKITLNKLTAEAGDTKNKIDGIDESPIDDVTDAAKEAGNALEDASGKASVFGDVLKAEMVTEGAKGIIEGLKDISEDSKEYRKIMGSLETSSEAAGYTAEETEEAYKRLYGVLADDQSAATTLANLQALKLEQGELLNLIDTTIGGWAKYGDSIPIDGLAEAINETVKSGEVTGNFADILNWGAEEGERYGIHLRDMTSLQDQYDEAVKSGANVSEEQIERLKKQLDEGKAWNQAVENSTAAADYFNLALQKCSSESERYNLIVGALADQGLPEMAEKWRENNASMVESNEASADLQEQLALIGENIEPLMTKVTNFVVQVLAWFNSLDSGTQGFVLSIIGIVAALGPVSSTFSNVSTVVDKLSGKSIPGLSSAFGKITDSVLPGLSNAFGTLTGTVLPGVQNAFSTVFSFIAANPVVLLIGAIIGLVALIATKGDEIQEILQKVDDFLQGIFVKDWTEIFGPVLGGILNGFFDKVKIIWDAIRDILNGIIDFIRGVFTGDWERAWQGVVNIFKGIFDGLAGLLRGPINGVIALVNKAIDAINWMIEGVNKIPGVDLNTIGHIPYLQDQQETIVQDADSAQITDAENTMLMNKLKLAEHLTGGGNYSTTTNIGGITIYGAEGQSAEELAAAVENKIMESYSRAVAGLNGAP